MKQLHVLNKAKPLFEQLLGSVQVIEDVQVLPGHLHGLSIDLLVEVAVKRERGQAARYKLFVVAKANGQPRWVKQAINQLDHQIGTFASSDPLYGVFVAPYISEASARILRENGKGYLDLAGNGLLAFDGIYIERTGYPNPQSERSELRTLFSPKASRILRVLLTCPYRPWKLTALAESVNVSIGLVAKVKPLLLDREWARETSEGGISLVNPDAALDAWAENHRRDKTLIHDYYGFGTLAEIEGRIAVMADEIGVNYVLAEYSGAERIAPHVRYNRATAYVEANVVDEIAQKAGLKEVDTGANVRLIEPYDEGVFFDARLVGETKIAHPIQLYLDLKKAGGRGDEAAEFLRQQVLARMWKEARSETTSIEPS